MHLKAYIDGSYNSNYHQYGGGVVVLVPNLEKPLEYKVNGNVPNYARLRNIAGELLAALAAIKIAQEVNCTKLTLYHDYEGIANWITGKWQPRKRFTIRYTQDVKAAIADGLDIEFVHVKAHSGDEYNELADRLAKEAAREVKLDA